MASYNMDNLITHMKVLIWTILDFNNSKAKKNEWVFKKVINYSFSQSGS
jgi:hypothetical protein